MKEGIWEEFYKASSELRKPVNIQGVLPERKIAEIKQLILEIFAEFLKRGELHIGLKTYINQELRNDTADKMYQNPPADGQSLEDWIEVLFGDQKFGIVLNSLEKYSNQFAERAAEIVEPLLKEAGLPLGGLSFLCFMGNYGFTPFGIHKEATGEEGILFHLGPGKKQFYTWDQPKYNVIEHNSQIFRDLDEMIPEAKCYELEPGDAMFIPHQVYHIANSSELSVSFVMDYINPPLDRLEIELAKQVGELEENLKQSSYVLPLKPDVKPKDWGTLLNKTSFMVKMEKVLQERILALKSNGGILLSSCVNSPAKLPSGSTKVHIKPVFKIQCLKNTAGVELLYCRGHRICVDKGDELLKLVERLNAGACISLDDMKQSLGEEWEWSEIFSLVSEWIRTESVEVIE
jgi:hypothetical protein